MSQFKPAPAESGDIARRPKAVIFDLGGVFATSVGQIFSEFERRTEIPQGTVVGIIIEHWGLGTDCWGQMERGELTTEEFEKRFGKLISVKVNREICAEGFIDSFKIITSRPKMVTAARRIRAEGVKTAILTNNAMYRDGSTILPVDKSLFDVITESCRVGLNKPDPRIFEHCLGELNVNASDAVFLDDTELHVKGARKVGLTAIKVGPDYETSLLELEAYLGFSIRD